MDNQVYDSVDEKRERNPHFHVFCLQSQIIPSDSAEPFDDNMTSQAAIKNNVWYISSIISVSNRFKSDPVLFAGLQELGSLSRAVLHQFPDVTLSLTSWATHHAQQPSRPTSSPRRPAHLALEHELHDRLTRRIDDVLLRARVGRAAGFGEELPEEVRFRLSSEVGRGGISP